jgi:hypothetical protein
MAEDDQLPADRTASTSEGDVTPSCFASTHAAAITAIPITAVIAVSRMRVICCLLAEAGVAILVSAEGAWTSRRRTRRTDS